MFVSSVLSNRKAGTASKKAMSYLKKELRSVPCGTGITEMLTFAGSCPLRSGGG
jgi:hypothetical protein